MFSFLLAISILGQCGDQCFSQGSYYRSAPYYTQGPVYQSSPRYNQGPTYVVGPPIYHELKNCGEIRSKIYVMATMANGKRLEIPIVNGYLPDVKTINNSDGSTTRIFNYSRQQAYEGGSPTYLYKEPETRVVTPEGKAYPKPLKVPKVETVTEPEPEPMKVPKVEPVIEPVVEPEKITPVPAPKSITPLMKKPSEVDGPSSKLSPTY